MIDYKSISETADFLKEKGFKEPAVGIILGTGLGKLADRIDVEISLDYAEIPHFPVSTVETHNGKLLYGNLSGKKVLAMQGRFHCYEGYQMRQIAFPVWVMKAIGVKKLLISNAAGNMNNSWKKGELMLIDDHINLLPGNPLIGANINEMGPRFPDMSAPYDKELNGLLEQIALEKQITLRKGVYVAVAGPNLETRAEYRFLRSIGADVVGMSTIPECIAANHCGLPCCAISVMTDDCDPDNLTPVNIAEIIAIAGKAEKSLTTLYEELIKRLN